MLKTWSKEQKHIALSSGEAELYAANTGAAEGLGLKSLMADLGIDCKVEVEIDASAACGIMQRRGLGHVRHVDTQDLWSQLAVKEGRFTIKKTWGKVNTADVGMKPLGRQDLEGHLVRMGFSSKYCLKNGEAS